MSMTEGYFINLVSQAIPLPESFLQEFQLNLGSSTFSEIQNNTSYNITGYSFLDKLERGTTSYTSKSFNKTNLSHELLGLYLLAVKRFLGLDYLPFYNWISHTQVSSTIKKSYMPYIYNSGEYSIYADSSFPITGYLSQVGQSSNKKGYSRTNYLFKINGSSKNKPFIFKTDFQPAFGKAELVLESNRNINISVLNGVYNINQVLPIFNSALSAKRYLITEEGNNTVLAKLIPSLSNPFFVNSNLQNGSDFSERLQATLIKSNYADKLLNLLLGTSITDKSNAEIKKELLRAFPGSSSVERVVKEATEGLYDIDSYSDQRLFFGETN